MIRVIYDKLLDMTGKVQVPIVLVGNKLDLSSERVIAFEDGKRLADYMKAEFMEISAKSNSDVNNLFASLLQMIERVRNDVTDKPEGKAKCALS